MKSNEIKNRQIAAIRDRFEKWFTFAPDEPEASTGYAVGQLVEHCDAKRGDCILDLGCGAGRHLAELSSKGYFNLHGVDFSSTAIERARRSLPVGGDIKLSCQDFREFLTGSGCGFDLVYSFDFTLSLYGAEDFASILELVKTRLAGGGRIFIELWNYENLLRSRPTDQYIEVPVDAGVLIYESSYRLSDGRIIFPASVRLADGEIIALEDQIQYLYSRDELAEICGKYSFAVEFFPNEQFSGSQYCLLNLIGK